MRTLVVCGVCWFAALGCSTAARSRESASVAEGAGCAIPPPLPAPVDERNVVGTPLVPCNPSLRAGFERSGTCTSGPSDVGVHVVCAEVTQAFLEFSRSRGNDLVTPRPEFDFPGLRPNDRWCLCAARWEEARAAGVAPPVILQATGARALDFVSRPELEAHARAGD